MKLKLVTFTGADDSTPQRELAYISKEYSFVEWAILVSRNRTDTNEYPSDSWLSSLLSFSHAKMNLSMHVCGGWARELVEGNGIPFIEKRGNVLPLFQRMQINGKYDLGSTNVEKCAKTLTQLHKEIIFQYNDALPFMLRREGVENISVLFDKSGGEGITPEKWPTPLDGMPVGYAGGLGPENLEEQLEKIAFVVKSREIWIDMQKNVRSNEGKRFDLEKVVKCLEIAKRYV